MRRPALAALFATLLVTASCESDIIDGFIDGEPNVGSMRISTGTQTITINSAGTVTGGPLILGFGSTVTITATFLTPDGDPDPNVTQASFQLNVTSSNLVSFQRNNVNPFAGTLTALGRGTTQLTFSLYDLEEQEDNFGPWTVPVVVN
jgi:hypothetical protein